MNQIATPQTFLTIHGAVMLALIALVSRKYRTLLNPVAFFGAYFFVASFLSPLLFLRLKLFVVSKDEIDYAIVLSMLYFATFAISYLVDLSPLRSPLRLVIRLSRPFISEASQVGSLGTALLAFEFVVFYTTLMAGSGAGTMWLTETRNAYQRYRGGVGVWWSLSQATLLLLFLTVLLRWGSTRLRVVTQTVLFAGVAFFLGSKAAMLAYPVVAAFYFHFCIRKIRTMTLTLGGAMLLALVVALQLIQRTADRVSDAMRYFDYFNYSASFLANFHNFDFRYGQIMASNLWYYVPRGLYPEKPFAYGQNLLIAFLNPGFQTTVRRTGFTPGMLQWSVPYADFGIPGVIAVAIFTAWVSKAAYEQFLAHRDLVSLVFMVQFGFVYYIELFPNAPFPIFWIWILAQGALFTMLRFLAPPAEGYAPSNSSVPA